MKKLLAVLCTFGLVCVMGAGIVGCTGEKKKDTPKADSKADAKKDDAPKADAAKKKE